MKIEPGLILDGRVESLELSILEGLKILNLGTLGDGLLLWNTNVLSERTLHHA